MTVTARPPGTRGIAPTKCKVCKRPEVARLVEMGIADGETNDTIAASLVRMGLTSPTARDALTPGVIAWHRQGGAWCDAAKTSQSTPAEIAPRNDLAALVRDRAVQLMQKGKLVPTLQHGLMAQALLDKRAERSADRQLALTVAGMLAGRSAPGTVIVSGVSRDVSEVPLIDVPDADDLGFPD